MLCREVQDKACAMLDKLLGSMLTPDRIPILGPLLQPILFRLAECVEANLAASSPNSLSEDSPVIKLIFKLSVQVQILLMSQSFCLGKLMTVCWVCTIRDRLLATLYSSKKFGDYGASALCLCMQPDCPVGAGAAARVPGPGGTVPRLSGVRGSQEAP